MIVLLLLAGVVGAIWWVVFIRRFGLMAGGLATLGTGICLGHPFFHFSSLTIDRLLFVALCGTFAVAWRTGQARVTQLRREDVPTLGLMLVILASTLLTDWNWNGGIPISRMVFYFLMPTVFYWVVRNIPTNERTAATIMGSIAVFGIYLSLTAMAEKFGQHWLVYPKYIASPEYSEFFGRGRGPILNPSGNGVLISAGLFSLLMYWPRAQRLGKLGVSLGFLIYAGGIFATLTRCVWLGAMLGLLVILLATFPPRFKWSIFMFGTLALVLLIPANWER
ncbi:MAG: hypothetical protein KDA60_04460, partial [Planctomycetales bacterium]|nr:hypothetical protein [Planctomycetales bacterium]